MSSVYMITYVGMLWYKEVSYKHKNWNFSWVPSSQANFLYNLRNWLKIVQKIIENRWPRMDRYEWKKCKFDWFMARNHTQNFVLRCFSIWFVINEVRPLLWCIIEFSICWSQQISQFGKKTPLIYVRILNKNDLNLAKVVLEWIELQQTQEKSHLSAEECSEMKSDIYNFNLVTFKSYNS